MGNTQSSEAAQVKVDPNADDNHTSNGSIKGSRNPSPSNSDSRKFDSRSANSHRQIQTSGQSPPSSQREPQSPEIVFSSQIPHSPTRRLPVPRRKHQRRGSHDPHDSSSPDLRRTATSPKMDRVDEIPESPNDDRMQFQLRTEAPMPSTSPKSSTRKSKKRKSKSNTMSQHDPLVTTSPTRDQAGNATQSSWAAINGSPHKNSQEEPKKKKRRHRKHQMQEPSVVDGSSEIEAGESPQLGNGHTNGINGAATQLALLNVSPPKKRKNTETNGKTPKKAKQNHKSNTADGPTSSSFSSLAETLYKNRNKKNHDSSDRDSDIDDVDAQNSDLPDADDQDVEDHGDDSGDFKPQENVEEEENDGSGDFEPTPRRRSGKRVAKSTFFEQLAQEEANGQNGHSSPSNARSSKSKSSKPSKAPKTPKTTKTKQPKISAMMNGHAEDDTPSTQHAPHEMAKGAFSEFELRNITQAVERWRDDHQMTQVEVNELIQGNPKEVKSQEFWAKIIPTCPNRKRQKIINQCRRKFHNFVARGTWTPQQQDELKRLWDIHGNKYALIGKLINRYPEDVRDRVRNYVVCGDNRRVDPWTPEEEEKLSNIVADALVSIRTQVESGDVEVEEDLEELIDWQKVSEFMDRTRSRLQCMAKWKLLARQKQAGDGSIDGRPVLSIEDTIANARDEADTMPDDERYKLVKAIRTYKSQADSRIPWARIREKQMDSRWTRPTLMLVWHRLKVSIADWNVMTIPEVVKELSKQYHDTQKLPFPNGDDYDDNAEYLEVESKVKKILKYQSKRATSEEVSEEVDDEEHEDSEDIEAHSQHDEDSEAEPDEADVSVEDKMETESDGPERPKRGGRKQAVSSSSSSKSSSHSMASTPSKRTPARHSAKAAREKSLDQDQVDEYDEVSSDTNASDASSIPARL